MQESGYLETRDNVVVPIWVCDFEAEAEFLAASHGLIIWQLIDEVFGYELPDQEAEFRRQASKGMEC